MYKVYKTEDGKLIILVSNRKIMEWYFDYDISTVSSTSSSYKKGFEDLIYKKRFEDLKNLIRISEKSFSIREIIIKYKDYDYAVKSNFEDNLKEYFDLFKKEVERTGYSFMEIELMGKCKVNDNEHTDCEIIQVSLERNNSISLSIGTNNLSFLPHNPVTKKKQFMLWKYNAPLLADVLEKFSQITDLQLIMEDGEFVKGGGEFCKEHPFYLKNSIIKNKINDFDELHIPFDLLESTC